MKTSKVNLTISNVREFQESRTKEFFIFIQSDAYVNDPQLKDNPPNGIVPVYLQFSNGSIFETIVKEHVLYQGSAMGWDEAGIPVLGCKIPEWDRDRDEFSGISGIRDGTGVSFGKPGWDRQDNDINTRTMRGGKVRVRAN